MNVFLRRGFFAVLGGALGLALVRRNMAAETNHSHLFDQHSCDALVLACIDFRFHDAAIAELRKMGVLKTYDSKNDAGACKHLVSGEKPAVAEWILENIGISRRLHGIKKVVIVNHYDCGAYGGNKSFASDQDQLSFHRRQLTEAKARITLSYPDLAVETYFAKPVGGKLQLIPF